jgi:hypothetical protein
MPFTPTDRLEGNPTVRIFFSGLMIIEPSEAGDSCEIFVNRSAPDHYLTIETRRKRPGRPDEIMMRFVGPLEFFQLRDANGQLQPPVHGFFIRANGTREDPGVRRYTGEPQLEGQSLDLAINLEGADFHNGSVGTVDPLGGRPSVFINDGTFYTAETVRPGLGIILQRPGAADRPLDNFASLIGANIYLDHADPEAKVTLMWRQQGLLKLLELMPEEDVSFEIYIVNDPLFESDSIFEPVHEEFREYYKILPQVPTSQQLRLITPPQPPGGQRGTLRSPCTSVLKGV